MAALLAVACAVALFGGQLNPYLGDYGDDAEFLVLGQALASGQGYAWVNTPDHPAHNRYPPGYPLFLAAVLAASGTAAEPARGILPAKLATGVTLLGGALLLGPLARRRLPGPWAAGAVALFVLNPFVIRFAGQVMSDVPYVLACLAALVWADALVGEEVGRPARWRWVVLGVLLAGGAYVRSIGLAAAAGALAWAWWWSWRRGRPVGEGRETWGVPPASRWGDALAATGAFLLLMVPWWLRDASLAGGWRYAQELLAAQYQAPSEGTVSSADLLSRAAGNAAFLAGKPGVFGLAGILAGLVAAGVCAVGYLSVARRGRAGAAEWVAVALVVAVLFWPIKTGRYLLPVIPLLSIYALAGALALGAAIGRPPGPAHGWRGGVRRWGAPAVGVAVAVFALLEGAYAAREAVANVRALAGGGGPAAYFRHRPEWARYLEAGAWLREHGGASDLTLARRQFALYVYSGRAVDKYRYDTTEEELAYLFSGDTRKYVVEDAFGELRGDFGPLPGAVRARGGDLRLRFETAAPAVRVWELVRPAPAPPP